MDATLSITNFCADLLLPSQPITTGSTSWECGPIIDLMEIITLERDLRL